MSGDGVESVDASSEAPILDSGIYSLVIAVDAPASVAVGALGDVAVERPAAVYVGSARGPGGFARIDRHREVARGDRDVRRWHVDHLLGHPAATVAGVVRSADGAECGVAARHREPPERAVGASADPAPIPGFGASDCDCPSHCVAFTDLDLAMAAAADAHRRTGGPWDAAWCNSYQDRGPPSV